MLHGLQEEQVPAPVAWVEGREDSPCEFEWFEIDREPAFWDSRVRALGQDVFHLSPMLKVHAGRESRLRGVVVRRAGGSVALLGGVWTVTAEGPLFQALSLPRALGDEDGRSVTELLGWLRGQAVATVRIGSYDGGAENCRVLPDGVEREYRLEFPWMLDGTEQDRMRVLHAGHRRKLSKLLRRKLRTERVRMLPAETLLLLRWRWAQRRGIRFTLRKALAYYLRYRMLDRCLTKNGHGALYGLYDEQGELLSVAYMLESPGTAFYMLGASSAAGYRIGASIRLFWDLAERYAERRLRYLSLGGVPAEAVEASHPEHGVYRFKSEFGIEPVRRVSLTCRGWGRA